MTFGCANDPHYMDTALEMSNNNKETATKAIYSQMELDASVAKALKDNEVALVLYAIQSKQNMAMLLDTLKTEIPDAPTNANDAWLGVGKAVVDGVTTIGKWYLGTSLLSDVFSNYGTAYTFTSAGSQTITDSFNVTKMGNNGTITRSVAESSAVEETATSE